MAKFEDTHITSILDGITSESAAHSLQAAMSAALTAQIMYLKAVVGETDVQIREKLLTTYAPAIHVIMLGKHNLSRQASSAEQIEAVKHKRPAPIR